MATFDLVFGPRREYLPLHRLSSIDLDIISSSIDASENQYEHLKSPLFVEPVVARLDDVTRRLGYGPCHNVQARRQTITQCWEIITRLIAYLQGILDLVVQRSSGSAGPSGRRGSESARDSPRITDFLIWVIIFYTSAIDHLHRCTVMSDGINLGESVLDEALVRAVPAVTVCLVSMPCVDG